MDSEYFNWIYYVTKYDDLYKSGVNTPSKAWAHWTLHGKYEGRSCYPQLYQYGKIPMYSFNLKTNRPLIINREQEEKISYFNDNVLDERILIFINFKPDVNKAYGGGNISTYYINKYLSNDFSGYKLTYDLNDEIFPDIYLIIDPYPDKYHKKYGLIDVIKHRNKYNSNGKIMYRVNDCDKTRPNQRKDRSREQIILKYNLEIDYFVYNSQFIKDNYYEKEQINTKPYSVIYNGCDTKLFYPLTGYKNSDKIKIVTHHWSNNMCKGYQLYYDLWLFCKESSVFEFVFIGNNVPDMFSEVPKIGPYAHSELSEHLNDCDIYITDSIWDSCPNHIIEGLMCGLPMLYTDHEGGGRELCNLPLDSIGEKFTDFNSMIKGLYKIVYNYDYYKQNVLKHRNIFDINDCCIKYMTSFNNIAYSYNYLTKTIPKSCVGRPVSITFDALEECFIQIINEKHIIHSFRILSGQHKIIFYNEFENTTFCCNTRKACNDSYIINNFEISPNMNSSKFEDNGDKYTMLYCSDKDYYVGMFSGILSFLRNTSHENLSKIHFAFITPIQDAECFTNTFNEFCKKINYVMPISIVYLDEKIVPNVVHESICVNGGNHLLNLCNFSRLMIGEFFNYTKLFYLDSDSIVQHDFINKLSNLDLNNKLLYAVCADKVGVTSDVSNVLHLKSIINTSYNWDSLIETNIDGNSHAFMGAPFYTDCSKWTDVYDLVISIIKKHNLSKEPLYKLFTMSLLNIVFYNKMGSIKGVRNNGVQAISELGSTRKKWTQDTLNNSDILDWSGLYKPWFKNGMHKERWDKYDILSLSESFDEVKDVKKGNIEKYKSNKLDYSNDNKYDLDQLEKLCLSDDVNLNKYLHKIIAKGNLYYYLSLFINDQHYKNKFLVSSPLKGTFNIIYFVDMKYFTSKMSRVRFLALEKLSERTGITLTYFGPGWPNYCDEDSVQDNLVRLGNGTFKIDFVIWYKPLNENFNPNKKLPFPTCIRYNEMWDDTHTSNEINNTRSDLIICHHKNDYDLYTGKLYKENLNDKQFAYIPHHADPKIFFNKKENRPIDILIAGTLGIKHYPLRYRLNELLQKHKKDKLKKYKIETLPHPGYNRNDAYTNHSLEKYAEYLNKSKICIACSSKWKYQLGKYIEIPMCGTVVCGDIPYEQDEYPEFVLEVNMDMTDDVIINKIIDLLDNPKKLKNLSTIGEKWSKKFTTDVYCDRLIKSMTDYKSNPKFFKKVFIISDEIRENHPEFNGQKWICDVLKDEFTKCNSDIVVSNALDADIIWYLAPWNYKFVPKNVGRSQWVKFLKTRDVVCTIHHVDIDKYKQGEHTSIFNFMKDYGTRYHVLCDSTYEFLRNNLKGHRAPITKHSLWVNTKIYNNNVNKKDLRNKYRLSHNSYYIGSFQKDTEGKSNMEPKLSKGPDIFVKIVEDIRNKNPNVEVLLTGLRREYIISKLKEKDIPYRYFNMVSLTEINDLYNCLDLYIVSSRVEGGPRAIVEAGFCKVPIISTDVGIASEFLPKESIYDVDDWKSYKDATPNVDKVFENVKHLDINHQIKVIRDFLIN